MGMRFNLVSANWLAHLLDPEIPIPKMQEPWMEKETLRLFLKKVERQFYSSRERELHFGALVREAIESLDSPYALRKLRRDLSYRH